MSERFMIIIAHGGEYGRRLARYLEKKLPAGTRILLYTNREILMQSSVIADYYIIDRNFFPGPEDVSGIPSERIIWLSDGLGSPQKLLNRLTGQAGDGEDPDRKQNRISVIYSPVNQGGLCELARNLMQTGDLYLGAEDIGFSEEKEVDMGDLCYFIHLKEEHILETMKQMLRKEEGRYYLDSADMYFFLREVTVDEYRWFFSRLRTGPYPEVYIGAGSGFLSEPAMFHLFDRIILADSQENIRQHYFCDCLENMLKEDYFAFRGEVLRVKA